MWRGLVETSATWVTVPLRLALGAIFIAHGAQKVFGLWEGPGLTKFASVAPPFAWMRPAWAWMGAAALAELLGGALVLTGLLTRLGALLILPVMLTAMLGVHWKGGFFLAGGIEYTLALTGVALALLIAGGGQLSADRALMGPRARRR